MNIGGSLAAVVGSPPPLAFTKEESDRAFETWRAMCGPHSLAAACGLSLERIRQALPADYEGWMSPGHIEFTLRRLRRRYRVTKGLRTQKLLPGINRVQFEGPWLAPGVPPAAAYRHTHWVAYARPWVLCTACDSAKWILIGDWAYRLRTSSGPFHVNHFYELASPR